MEDSFLDRLDERQRAFGYQECSKHGYIGLNCPTCYEEYEEELNKKKIVSFGIQCIEMFTGKKLDDLDKKIVEGWYNKIHRV